MNRITVARNRTTEELITLSRFYGRTPTLMSQAYGSSLGIGIGPHGEPS